MTDTDKLYNIKPLEWRESAGWFSNMWKADVDLGMYTVQPHRWGYYFNEADENEFPCTSVEAGKAAAEAHWRERILPMLTEVE